MKTVDADCWSSTARSMAMVGTFPTASHVESSPTLEDGRVFFGPARMASSVWCCPMMASQGRFGMLAAITWMPHRLSPADWCLPARWSVTTANCRS